MISLLNVKYEMSNKKVVAFRSFLQAPPGDKIIGNLSVTCSD